MTALKTKIVLVQINYRYDPDPVGQATFDRGHKITALI